MQQVLNAKEDAAKMAQAAVRKAEKRLKQLLDKLTLCHEVCLPRSLSGSDTFQPIR